MDIKQVLTTAIFVIIPIIFILWFVIAKPILDELKTIKEKLNKLNEKNQDEPKE